MFGQLQCQEWKVFFTESTSITVLIQPAAEGEKGLKISYLAGEGTLRRYFEKVLRSYKLITAGGMMACVSRVDE